MLWRPVGVHLTLRQDTGQPVGLRPGTEQQQEAGQSVAITGAVSGVDLTATNWTRELMTQGPLGQALGRAQTTRCCLTVLNSKPPKGLNFPSNKSISRGKSKVIKRMHNPATYNHDVFCSFKKYQGCKAA